MGIRIKKKQKNIYGTCTNNKTNQQQINLTNNKKQPNKQPLTGHPDPTRLIPVIDQQDIKPWSPQPHNQARAPQEALNNYAKRGGQKPRTHV